MADRACLILVGADGTRVNQPSAIVQDCERCVRPGASTAQSSTSEPKTLADPLNIAQSTATRRTVGACRREARPTADTRRSPSAESLWLSFPK
jgi:hypothetical protein